MQPAPSAQSSPSDADLAELFPWLAVGADAEAGGGGGSEPGDVDDACCIVCLDAPRDTALAGCAGVHDPMLCAACAVAVTTSARAACLWCGAPCGAPVGAA